MHKLDELRDELLPSVRRNMETSGGLIPTLFVMPVAGPIVVIAVPWPEGKKDEALIALGRALQTIPIYGAILFSEAWTRNVNDDEDAHNSPPPSECADRKEAIICCEFAKNKIRSSLYLFERDGAKIVWGEPHTSKWGDAELWSSGFRAIANAISVEVQ